MKKAIIISFLTLLASSSYSQRLSMKDFVQFCTLVTMTNSGSPISSSLKSKAVNWQAPEITKTGTDNVYLWKYIFERNAVSRLTLELSTEYKGFFIFRYSFIYKAQYQELFDEVTSYAEMINAFTEEGANYKIYQTKALIFAFITYPASLKRYYKDGKPVEGYKFELQKRVD